MKSSIALAAAGSLLALASPVDKRALVTHVVVHTEFAYVYPDGSKATHFPAAFFRGGAPKEDIPEPIPTPEPIPSPESVPEAKILPDIDLDLDIPVPELDLPEAKAPEYEQPAPVADEPVANDFIGAALAAHNRHRAKHPGCNPLTWDDELARWAANAAATCVFEHDTSDAKAAGRQVGQNIAFEGNSASVASDEEAVDNAASGQWYLSELPFYENFFGSEPSMSSFSKWGHLSQVVWKGTTKVGCAVHTCPPGTLADFKTSYTVCNYNPPGNWAGEYSDNVPPPTS